MSDIRTEYAWVTSERGLLPDLGLGLILLSGDDALDWLQGQATNDLRKLSVDKHVSFCLCEPTGQLLALCDIWDTTRGLIISTDNPAAVLDRVDKMVILEDVHAQDITSDYDVVSVQGPTAAGYVEFFSVAIRLESRPDAADCLFLTHPLLGDSGLDMLIPKSWHVEFGRISQETYEILRIEFGTPLRGIDYTSKTLPPELGPAFDQKYVSYNKGCYTGQEVLMRIHSRGHTNKTWVGLLLDEPLEAGAKVSLESKEDAGVITSAAISPRLGPIAAAMLRNEAAKEGEEVQVGAVRGIVHHMPLRRLAE